MATQPNSVPALVTSGADQLASGPPAFAAFVQSGAPMPTLRRNITTAFNQIPRWAYGLVALVTFYGAYKSYKTWKGTKKHGHGATS